MTVQRLRRIARGISKTRGAKATLKLGLEGLEEVSCSAIKCLARYGNREYYDKEMMVSKIFYDNLNEHNQKLLKWNSNRNCYHGKVINVGMNEWYKENCK